MIQLANQDFLSGFNCAFNGIDEPKLRDLVSGDFIKRGENLLLIGGDGTGKGVIANQIEQAAAALGFSSHYLVADYEPFAPTHFLERPPLLEEHTPSFRNELLEVDVLIFPHAHIWFAIAPHEFTYLVCQRIAQGKSNILLMPSHGWKRAIREQYSDGSLNPGAALRALAELASRSRAKWAESIVRSPKMSFELQIQVLGIGLLNWSDPSKTYLFDLLSVPNTPEANVLQTEFALAPYSWCNQSLTEWMYGPGWKPVWQVLYTGAKNYRHILERR